MKIMERIQGRAHKLFRNVRRVGLILAAISGSLLASPVALPGTIKLVAGYMALLGSIALAVSQALLAGEEKPGEC